MAMITSNLRHIQGDISLICQQLGRDPQDITVVGITKFASVEMIDQALAAGLSHIGENKVQQAAQKFSALTPVAATVTKLMVGHLQTNKVKDALEIFDIIQSVDSLKLAQAIEKHAAAAHKRAVILIQVNTAGEIQKFGITPSEAEALIAQIALLEHIHIHGLMAIAPLTDDAECIRSCFRSLRVLRDRLAQKYADNERVAMRYLSMGMSADYKIALEEGSNMLRIGTALFS